MLTNNDAREGFRQLAFLAGSVTALPAFLSQSVERNPQGRLMIMVDVCMGNLSRNYTGSINNSKKVYRIE